MTRPRRGTFDYPAPNGTWLRVTRYSPMPRVGARQGWIVGAGDRVRVYVNPANPVVGASYEDSTSMVTSTGAQCYSEDLWKEWVECG